MASKGIFHINLVVRDLDQSIRFYRNVFGFVDSGLRDGELAFLYTPGGDDLLSLDPSADARETAGQQGGVSHFGIRVEDMNYDAWAAAVVDHGGRIVERGIFPTGDPSLYVADPDGYVLEIQGPMAADSSDVERIKDALTPPS
jgi:catechol 2,3-dioxygenase-like lactoylglutathione lyase family enzyme